MCLGLMSILIQLGILSRHPIDSDWTCGVETLFSRATSKDANYFWETALIGTGIDLLIFELTTELAGRINQKST